RLRRLTPFILPAFPDSHRVRGAWWPITVTPCVNVVCPDGKVGSHARGATRCRGRDQCRSGGGTGRVARSGSPLGEPARGPVGNPAGPVRYAGSAGHADGLCRLPRAAEGLPDALLADARDRVAPQHAGSVGDVVPAGPGLAPAGRAPRPGPLSGPRRGESVPLGGPARRQEGHGTREPCHAAGHGGSNDPGPGGTRRLVR